MREPPGHGEDPVEESERALDLLRIEVTPCDRDLERVRGLPGAPGGDAEVLEPVASLSPRAFAQVQDHRGPRVLELIREPAVLRADLRDERSQSGDHELRDLESFESVHRFPPKGERPPLVPSPKRGREV